MNKKDLNERVLYYWNEIYDDINAPQNYKESLIKGLKAENNPENICDFLDRSFGYLHEERMKYEFGLNEEECKPISQGLLCCCKAISEKMTEQSDVEYGNIAEKIRKCLSECVY